MNHFHSTGSAGGCLNERVLRRPRLLRWRAAANPVRVLYLPGAQLVATPDVLVASPQRHSDREPDCRNDEPEDGLSFPKTPSRQTPHRSPFSATSLEWPRYWTY